MRWSKPHVASLSLHSLFELRSSLTSGACMLEMNAKSMGQLAGMYVNSHFDLKSSYLTLKICMVFYIMQTMLLINKLKK